MMLENEETAKGNINVDYPHYNYFDIYNYD